MITPSVCCQSCGAWLGSPDSVCAQCEGELAQEDRPCNFRCPACRRGFFAPELALFPARAPWFRWQAQRPVCPHCHCVLRDRTVAKATRKQWLVYVALIIGSQFLPGTWPPRILLVSTMLGYAILLRQRKLDGIPAWERYVRDDSPSHPPLI